MLCWSRRRVVRLPGVTDAISEKQTVGKIEMENRENVGVLSITTDISTVVVRTARGVPALLI
jgi:hypothetical protein